MNDGSMDAGPRLKPRWTLGRLMLLIAVLAVPLALIVQQQRRVERMRREAEAALAQAKANQDRALRAVEDMLKATSESTAPLPSPSAPPTWEDAR